MDVTDLFKKKEPSQEELMNRQFKQNKENIFVENATHPGHADEQWLAEQKEKFADLRRWQQNLEPKFRQLFEKFAGVKVTDSGQIIAVPHINPRMNINGAYHIINFLEVLDVNVIMSNYSYEGIKIALRHGVGYPLIQFIKDNYKEFGITKNFGNLRYVITTAMNTAEPTFYRALNAGERNLDGKIYKINRIENEGQKEEKKSIWKK